MSTRGIIAEPHEGSWRGRYHHWDSYPSGVGKTLWTLKHERFQDIAQLRKVLLHDHTGWSTINADWDLVPGYVNPGSKENDHRPQCYCHGDRHEEGSWMLPDKAGDSWCEWLYILEDSGLRVSRIEGNESILLPWDGPEPDWKKLEESL